MGVVPSILQLASLTLVLLAYYLRYKIEIPYIGQSLDFPEMAVMGISMLLYIFPLLIISGIISLGVSVWLISYIISVNHKKFQASVILIISIVTVFLLINFRFPWVSIFVPNDWFWFS
jgi:hypothetical protein